MSEDYSDADMSGELISLAVKAGRRASHDLAHASSCLYIAGDEELGKFFEDRANNWLKIFYMDDNSGVKDYQHRLHKTIGDLEREIARLKRRMEEHGVPPDPDEIPF